MAARANIYDFYGCLGLNLSAVQDRRTADDQCPRNAKSCASCYVKQSRNAKLLEVFAHIWF